MAGDFGIRENHCHARRFGGDDEWTEVAPEYIDRRFGVLLLSRLGHNIRHYCPI
jgi:hypothetical protein